jgi:hypothetical protein
MKPQGWAVSGVMLACALMSAASLGVWLDLASSQSATAQRQWLFQSKAAAEALIRETQSAWTLAPPAPTSGCQKGRCAWQGSAGLARSFWAALWPSAGTWGTFDHASLSTGWPTLPGSQLYGWLETTTSPDGTLVRITAWVQGPISTQSTVMQAVWLSGSGSNASAWVSWREVMP